MMIIIGEKINGAIPSASALIAGRDEAAIADLARRQVETGANFIDVCAGNAGEEELETLLWLIDVVEAAVDTAKTPLCVDSPDPRTLLTAAEHVAHPGMLNSISLEGEKCELVLPWLAAHPEWHTVALCCDNAGLAAAAEDKLRLAGELVARAEAAGVAAERLHIDPLVLAVSAAGDGAVQFIKATKLILEAYPEVHIAAGVSNVSYGMPARPVVNRVFLALTIEAGLDTPIIDPCAKSVAETLFATEAVLGRDKHCRKYNNAYRKGLIGTKK